MIEKEFIPYQEALALKELGFNEPCFGYHLCKNSALGVYLEITTEWIDLFPYDSSSCKAPTYSQAFRWFREKYFKMCFVYYDVEYKFCFCIGYNDKTKGFKTYEEAELECLRKLIELTQVEKINRR